MKKVTLKQIAAEAGVSPSTISRIVNHNTPVSETLKNRVEIAMQSLGASLPAAKSEKRNYQNQPPMIGLMVADLSNPYFQMVMRGVMNEARNLDYGVQLFETKEDVSHEETIFRKLPDYHLDGLILCAARVSTGLVISFRKQTGIPIVMVNRYVADPKIRCIVIDYKKALFQATSYLIKLGHRDIAYLSGPSSTEASRLRRSGILKAMNDANIKMNPAFSLGCFPSVEGGFQATTSLLSLPGEHPTAVIAYNDLIAVGAMQAIRLHGLRIPEDISLMGVDNIELANYTTPPLTTIAPPVLHMGSVAIRIIDSLIKGEPVPEGGYMEIEASLILRYSTGPAPEKTKQDVQADHA